MVKEGFNRDDANVQLNKLILGILTDELPLLKKKIRKLCLEIKRAKYLIYIFSGALFVIGIFFLIVALNIAYPSSNGGGDWKEILEVLGFGAASGTSFISVLLLQPIKRIQKANSDASQAEMVYYCWELGILLHIRAMDITKRDSIKEAAKKIGEITSTSVELLEKYYELEIPEE